MKNQKSKIKKDFWVAGLDEVGRGSIAGPVCVGASLWRFGERDDFFYGIKDSKKLSPIQRQIWLEKLFDCNVIFSLGVSSVKEIDKRGISWSLKKAVERAIGGLPRIPDFIFSDAGLSIPDDFPFFSMIKGDEKIPLVSAASIFAKQSRDSLMNKIGVKIPQYGFSKNKGYGTKSHFIALKKFGLSNHHRRSFLKNF